MLTTNFKLFSFHLKKLYIRMPPPPWLTVLLFKMNLIIKLFDIYIIYIYISYIHSYQNSPIIMTNGIKKVRKGVDIFNKRIFDSCKLYLGQCFRIQPCLSQLSFPRSQHIINWYHSAWCTTYQDSTLDVSIFLVSGKREREERERETTIFFFFS